MSAGLKVCVLQPDYSASNVDYRHYDPPRDLAPLLPHATVHHVFLDKRTVFRQLQESTREKYDIYVNLCEGYLDWDVPSIDVIHALEQLRLPYTGPTPALYDPAKPLMKYVAFAAGVTTPRHVVVSSLDEVTARVTHAANPLTFPLFVKPAHAGDSRGVDDDSRVATPAALTYAVSRRLAEFPTLLVEEYIDGREFTVLVAATADGGVRAFRPVEYDFGDGVHFKTYALKTSALHPTANRPVTDEAVAARLADAAIRIFRGFSGVGYARLDFRQDDAGALHFLEINFTCSVFYPEGLEGSADHILRFDGIGPAAFLELITAEGMARHRRKQPVTEMRGDSIAGYGTFALRDFAPGDVVFEGEERPFNVVTLPHVQQHWTAEQQLQFRRYGYPLSHFVYALWSDDPNAWRPQNHSCLPNTTFRGLDVVALRAIANGEELTLDYSAAMNELSEPFDCRCGLPNCRGRIAGTPGNSVTERTRPIGT
ncbi:MAG: SET domain-containing protein-lysine N-methyltransferase [Gemmatimonadaceae bacterium]|nr:SET domain-containing protein-lysine N-methyltransferase [Gemmatimonadaceae bacterium]